MKTRKLFKKQHSKSDKAQLDIDLLLAYIVFIAFIVFIIRFSINLLTPYTNTIDFSIHQRNALKVYHNSIPSVFDYNDLYKLCNVNATELNGVKVIYNIKGVKLPAWDDLIEYPNNTDGKIIILRKNENLEILFGSNSTEYNTTLIMVFPQYSNVFIENDSLETQDLISLEKDSFQNDVITINSNVKSNDLDKVMIKTDSKTSPFFVFISGIYGINHNRVFVGSASINGSCSSGGSGYKQELYGNALMNVNGSDTIVELTQKTWWIS